MKSDIHLRLSKEPLVIGGDEVSLCGKVIPKAEAVALGPELESPSDHPRLCRKCGAVATGEGLHYETGIVPGMESLAA